MIKVGKTKWFEYHCYESLDSADYELWIRSHQRVIVGECENESEFGNLTLQERHNEGTPLVYQITFVDGFVGAAFEDELLTSKKHFCRPNPPTATPHGYQVLSKGEYHD